MIKEKGKYYLYRHIRTDKNQVFYVGIGAKRSKFAVHDEYSRAYYKSGRNIIWNSITIRTDYVIEIVMESDDYDFIKEKEKEFILLYGRIDLKTGTLANLTDGGEGTKYGPLMIEHMKKKRKEIAKYGKDNPISKKIYQYSMNGIFIKEWNSLADVKRELGNKYKHICECAKGKIRSVGGFQWRYYMVDCIEPYTNNLCSKISKVIQMDKNNNILREWNSLQDVVNFLKKKNSANLYANISGKSKSAYGFKWTVEYKIA